MRLAKIKSERAAWNIYFYNAMRLRNMVFSFALGRCKIFRGPVSGTSGARRFLPALRRPLEELLFGASQ